jgi:hypothetical protein
MICKTHLIPLAGALALAAASSAMAEPLPTFGHYAASVLTVSVTPSADGVTCSSASPAGTSVQGEFALNTVNNIPAQLFRYIAADSQTVVKENFAITGGTRKNQTGTVTISAYSVANGKQVLGQLPYTAAFADYDPNSFGGTITVTFPGDSGGSCAQVNNVALVRTSAD